MAIFSNATGTGLFADSDSTTVWLPLQDVVNSTRYDELLTILDGEISGTNASSLIHAQLIAQRELFTRSDVAAAEIIQWTYGLVPQPNQSYVTILGGVLVRACLEGVLHNVERYFIASC
jgi:hypothetical protein